MVSAASAICALAVVAVSTAVYTLGDMIRSSGGLNMPHVALAGALFIVGAVLIELGKCIPAADKKGGA